MNIKEISTLVQQKTIPTSIQEDVIMRAKKLISDGFEVEAIASTTNVTIDVYDESGTRIDRIKRTFSKEKVATIEGIKPDNLEFFE
jgi:hypothetical protein